jgi:Tfp pilus assembly protein PilO
MNRTIKQRWQLRQENEIITKALIELKSAEENFENLNTLLADTKTELEFLNKRIPVSVNIGEVLKEIDYLMKNRKIILLSLQPLPPVEEKLYTKIPIRLMFEGSFASIYHLLYDLETMNRMLVAENMSITRRNLDEKCQAEITASVYQRLRE